MRGKVELVIHLCHLKISCPNAVLLRLSWLAPSRYPLQLRWRPLAAAEAGAAASGAAGIPVRWPRRPTAVSDAVAAGAGPDFSCAAGQKRAAKPPNGEVSSLSVVCVCVSGSVGRVWSCGRSSPILVVWGGSPASDWLVFSIFPGKGKISIGASFVPGCQSGVLFVCLLACLLRHLSPRSSCSAVFVVVALARVRLAIGVACTHTSGG